MFLFDVLTTSSCLSKAILAKPDSSGVSSLDEDSLEDELDEDDELLELDDSVPESECSLPLVPSSLVDVSDEVMISPPSTGSEQPPRSSKETIPKNNVVFFIHYYSKLLKNIFNNNKNSTELAIKKKTL